MFGTTISNIFADSFDFKQYTSDHGLTQITILALHQDQDGMLWIGTRNGLNSFDGYNFKNYYHSPWDSTSLMHNHVEVLEGDKDNGLWIGTNGGLCRLDFETGVFKPYRLQTNSKIAWQIKELEIDKNGNLWIVSNLGIFILYEGSNNFTHVRPVPNENQSPSIQHVVCDNDNEIWLGGYSGFFKIIHSKGTLVIKKREINHKNQSLKEVTGLHTTDQGKIWIGSISHLWEYSPNTESAAAYPNIYSMGRKDIPFENRSFVNGVDNTFWIASYKGVFVFDVAQKKYVQNIHHDPNDNFSLSDNSVHSMLVTDQGDRWVGTYSGGLNYYSPYKKAFELHRHSLESPSSLNSNIINEFIEGPNGKIFIATSRGGLNIWDEKNQTYQHAITDKNIRHMFYDRNEQLWLGTLFNGLIKIDPETLEPFFYRKSAPKATEQIDKNNSTGAVFLEDQTGQFWVGSWNAIYQYIADLDEFEEYQYPIAEQWVEHTLRDMIEVDNEIWVASETGIQIFYKNKKHFGKVLLHIKGDKRSLPSNHITYFTKDNNGQIWVASYGGISQYHPEDQSFTNYDISDGLPSNMVLCMLVDANNNLWLSTSKGLAMFNQVNKKIKIFDQSNNLQSSAFRDGACLACEDGDFIFGGINGFNKFDPTEIHEDSSLLKTVFTDLLLFNQEIEPGNHSIIKKNLRYLDTLVLNYDQNVLSIGYTAADYFDQAKTHYSYTMEGFEDNWNEVGSTRLATYTNLSPGTYTFRVKAANANGDYNPDETSLTIVIIPPFWKTAWFQVTLLSFIAMMLWGIHFFRVKILIQQSRRLDSLVQERTEIIDGQNNKLKEQNHKLTQAEEEIRTSHDLLQEANSNLEEKVAIRTQKLDLQNQKIKEYAFLNSHKVRAPLVRILGLVRLYSTGQLTDDELKYVNDNIEKSALELDGITKKINKELDD